MYKVKETYIVEYNDTLHDSIVEVINYLTGCQPSDISAKYPAEHDGIHFYETHHRKCCQQDFNISAETRNDGEHNIAILEEIQ